MSREIGPTSPLNLSTRSCNDDKNLGESADSNEIVIGPQFPPHFTKEGNHIYDDKSGDNTQETHGKLAEEETRLIGPKLPFRSPENQALKAERGIIKNYGPSLPPGFSNNTDVSDNTMLEMNKGNLVPGGPSDESDDDEIIGPCLPSNLDSDSSSVQIDFEVRAKAMKDKLTGKESISKSEKLERESWMTELPPEIGKNFGLGPRKFRGNAQEIGDRSVWTDTPQDRERKQREAAEVQPECKKVKVATEEELEMQTLVAEYNEAKRPQSLLDMHRAKGGEKTVTRQPFDRDRDLSLNRRDPKQVAKFIQQAKSMNDKFSAGNFENKFL